MATKHVYVAAKKIAVAKFTSADKSQSLVITGTEGKGKFNIRASVKDLKEEADDATTGARQSFATQEDLTKAFAKLVSEAKARGWVEVASSVNSRNAFTSIPAPAAPAKTAKK